MNLRKICSVLVAAVFMVSTMGMSVASADTPETVQAKLAAVEKDTYGTEQTGSIIDRISKLEKDYDGVNRTGSMMARVNAIYAEVYTNSPKPSVLADLNAIEWNIDHQVSMNSVEKRVADMEMEIAGQTSTGTYKQRIKKLSQSSFGSATLPLHQVTVPANTLIKVSLVDPVNTKNLKAGDTIRYQVASDVIVNNHLVFAKGEPGEATVTSVKQARNFGRNAKLEMDYKYAKSIDGTDVSTYMGEESKEEMKNLAMAAGASLAGIALLGPIGIIGGAFVNGKNIDLPVGTEFYIQTQADTILYGVATTVSAK